MGLADVVRYFTHAFTATVIECALVSLVSELTDVKLQMNSVTISVLATVTSLVVSFQANNSYARWWEGRNLWSAISTNSRQMAMLLWIGAGPPKPPTDKPADKDKKGAQGQPGPDTSQDASGAEGQMAGTDAKDEGSEEHDAVALLIGKKSYINLVHAFAVATKHALRGEHGPFYADLYPLIAFLPRYNPSVARPGRADVLGPWRSGVPSDSSVDCDVLAVPLTPAFKLNSTCDEKTAGESTFDMLARAKDAATRLGGEDGKAPEIRIIELLPPRHPPPAKIYDWFPFIRQLERFTNLFKSDERLQASGRDKSGKRRRSGGVRLAIPQEILHYLGLYINTLLASGAINSSITGPLLTNLLNLSSALSDLEKVATTPLPSAYRAHLRLTVWCYLFFLPFQLYEYLAWLTIPATAVAAVTYLGFLEIGGQIEMPFGYDETDLDLDSYVLRIGAQLGAVTAFPTKQPTSLMPLSPLNQPFVPTLSMSATDMLGAEPPPTSPTRKGFAAAYESPATTLSSDEDSSSDGLALSHGTYDSERPQNASATLTETCNSATRPDSPRPRRSVRALETTLLANAREAYEMQYFQLADLEKPTGLGVAVALL
ncbi:hypothetical protein Q5752_000351 [Cryptotrichosporon argae]